MTVEARAPDAVVVAHHVHALRVRQVAAFHEEAEDAPTAEIELLPDDALEVRHHATRVQVHEQPAHAAVHDGRRRVVKEQAHADGGVTVGCHASRQNTAARVPPAFGRVFPIGIFRIRVSSPCQHRSLLLFPPP